MHPAEPVSLSLVASHHTLTQLLLYLMRYFLATAEDELLDRLGASYDEQTITELYTMCKVARPFMCPSRARGRERAVPLLRSRLHPHAHAQAHPLPLSKATHAHERA